MREIATYGWDVIYAMQYDMINQSIQADHRYPKQFSAEKKIVGSLYSISGSWASWTLKNGGSGKNIWLECFVSAGSLFNENNEVIYDLTATRLTIQVNLAKFHDQTKSIKDSSSVNEGKAWLLRVNSQATENSKAVVILASEYRNIPAEDSAIIDQLFDNYFNNNIQQFDQIFTIVMLELEAKDKDLQWIKPSAFSYAVQSVPVGKSDDLFGCLNRIDGKTAIEHLQQSLDARIGNYFSNHVNGLIIVSKEIYTKHFLLPAALNLLKGSKAEDFAISEQGLSIHNKVPLTWGNFVIGSEESPETVAPLIPANGLQINLQGENINLNVSGATFRPKSGGVTTTININQSMGFTTVRKNANEVIFIPDLNNIKQANINISNKVDKGSIIGQIIGGVLILMASIVAGVATWRDYSIVTAISGGTRISGETIAYTYKISGAVPKEFYRIAFVTADSMDNHKIIPVSLPWFNFLAVGQSVVANFTRAAVSATDLVKASLNKEYVAISTFEQFVHNFTNTHSLSNSKIAKIESAQFADSLVIGVKLATG
ncbi:MAG TPA: TULIP family P47-like protein [Arsenophonus nasoniae]|uniref:TULIP family P47-like protein n=1 Tax=Arsenophonus nasoniae TaxID=638 RepID=UPI003879FA42